MMVMIKCKTNLPPDVPTWVVFKQSLGWTFPICTGWPIRKYVQVIAVSKTHLRSSKLKLLYWRVRRYFPDLVFTFYTFLYHNNSHVHIETCGIFPCTKNTIWKQILYPNSICMFWLILFAVPVYLYGCICVFIWLYLECLWICICIFIWLYLQCLHSCIVFIWLYLQCFYYSICIFIRLYSTIVFAVFLFGCICRYHSSAPVRYSVHQRFRSRFLWPNNNNTNNNKNYENK